MIDFIKKIIYSPEFCFRHRRSEKDFIRKRLLPFDRLVLFMINFLKGSIQDELHHFFKAIAGPAKISITKAAFCLARKKIRHTAFLELQACLRKYFEAHFTLKRFQGFRLLGIDCSLVDLPKTQEIGEHFGGWHPRQGGFCPKARASVLFDVLNRVTLEAIIAPKSNGERKLAAQHIQGLGPSDLVICDRGFPAFWLFTLILSQGAHFCCRLVLRHWLDVDLFYRSGKPEAIIPLSPSPASIRQCQALGLAITPIKVRLIRLTLPNGETEILATSLLDTELYPYPQFQTLYQLRWGVEEDFKFFKSRLQIENFSGKSVASVYQDFHAKVFAASLVAILALTAQKVVDQKEIEKPKKHHYQINFAQALSKAKDTLVFTLNSSNIFPLIKNFLALISKTLEPVRPGRQFPRKNKTRPRFSFAYKPLR